MVQDSARSLLNGAIEALLDEDSIANRICYANRFIGDLEAYRDEVPTGCLEKLKEIIDQLINLKEFGEKNQLSDHHLVAEQELAITDELLSLYIVSSGGALIF